MGKVLRSIPVDEWTRGEPGGLTFEPSKTKQEFAEEADINRLMERYTLTGEIPVGITGTYGDFSDAPDFMQAQEIVLRAQQQFAALPAKVRARFENDPAQFLAFVHDEANYGELRELGLLSKEAEARADAERAAAEAWVAAAASSGVPTK